MRSSFAMLAAGLLLAGCATVSPSVPEGYKGPVATVKDSYTRLSTGAANLFYLDKIDGREIENAQGATFAASYGHGLALTAVAPDRKVPAQEATFHLVGRTMHAAPIQSLLGTEYRVIGDVHFTPQPDRVYVVRGELNSAHSVVWVEDEQTHDVMDKKVEIEGNASLSVFSK